MGASVRVLGQVAGLFGAGGGVVSPGVAPGGPATGSLVAGWSGDAGAAAARSAVELGAGRDRFAGGDGGVASWGSTTVADVAAGRSAAVGLTNSAQVTGNSLVPYAQSVPGRAALVAAMSQHVDAGAGLVSGWGMSVPERRAALYALAAQFGLSPQDLKEHRPGAPRRHRGGQRHGHRPGGPGGKGLGGLGQQLGSFGRGGTPSSGGGGGLGGALSSLSGAFTHNNTAPGIAPAGAQSGPVGPSGLGSLTAGSSQKEIGAAIVREALHRGYSPAQAVAILSTAMRESNLSPRANGGGGAWHGIFQQDTSYRGRDNPNINIGEFFNRLAGHGGPASPDIWKSIFWLQQRPGEASAEIAYAHGRQAYLREIQSEHGRATAMYHEIVGR